MDEVAASPPADEDAAEAAIRELAAAYDDDDEATFDEDELADTSAMGGLLGTTTRDALNASMHSTCSSMISGEDLGASLESRGAAPLWSVEGAESSAIFGVGLGAGTLGASIGRGHAHH